MKFGVWVEPERVDLRLVGDAGMPREEWLAQSDGLYQPGVPNDERAHRAARSRRARSARRGCSTSSPRSSSEQGVDYLKWDSNFWINNTRAGPDAARATATSSTSAGSIWCSPRSEARFPDLTIENCSGGGNRLDLGLMRYTDVGWMDDRTVALRARAAQSRRA